MKAAPKACYATGSSLAVSPSALSLVVIFGGCSCRSLKLPCFFAAASSVQLPPKPRRQQRGGMTETALAVPTPRAASTWPMEVASKVRYATGQHESPSLIIRHFVWSLNAVACVVQQLQQKVQSIAVQSCHDFLQQ